MGLQVVLDHRTEYRYDRPVSLGPQVIQLRPAPHSRTPILSYSLTLTPSEHILNWQLDPHSNYAARVLILQKTSEFAVQVQLVADLAPINPFNFFLEPGFEDYPFEYSPQLAKDLEPYRSTETAGPRLQSLSGQCFARETWDYRLPGRPESACARRSRIRHPLGAGRAEL